MEEEICENCGQVKSNHYMVYGKYYYCDTKHTKEFKPKKQKNKENGKRI